MLLSRGGVGFRISLKLRLGLIYGLLYLGFFYFFMLSLFITGAIGVVIIV